MISATCHVRANIKPCTATQMPASQSCGAWCGAHSEETATMMVMPVSVPIAATSDSAGVLSSVLSLKKLACVFS